MSNETQPDPVNLQAPAPEPAPATPSAAAPAAPAAPAAETKAPKPPKAPKATAAPAVEPPPAEKAPEPELFGEWIGSVLHRIPEEAVPEFRSMVTRGVQAALDRCGQKTIGAAPTAWIEQFRRLSPAMRSEVAGMVKGIVEHEVAKRLVWMHDLG